MLPSGIYEHYKGDRYFVLGYSSDSTNRYNGLEPPVVPPVVVVYISMGMPRKEPAETPMHHRDAREFNESVCGKRGCACYGKKPSTACYNDHRDRVRPRFKFLRSA
jgi:hypothetical protein